MNVMCSLLICGLIFYESRRFAKILGHADGGNSVFNSVISMIVEAMLPYTLFGVAYVTLLGLNSPVAILFLSLYIMFTVRATIP